MNSRNETIVSGEMYRRMKEAGVTEGYEPVPDSLRGPAETALAGNAIADMPASFKKRLTRNQLKARRRALRGK